MCIPGGAIFLGELAENQLARKKAQLRVALGPGQIRPSSVAVAALALAFGITDYSTLDWLDGLIRDLDN
jgi:hypothetical protein